MIKDNSVVGLSYRLKNDQGEELDKADAKDPFFYLHGHGQIVPGLEAALIGMSAGDKTSISIDPDQAYGNLDPQLKMQIDKSQFPPEEKLQVGMRFFADVGSGRVLFTVIDVKENMVFIDGNHPLAGQRLHFDVEVLTIREATEEELAHGHVHGPGGHHH